MRYHETREQSGEVLRLTLQLMGRHNAAFHPVSYAVWYEYAAGLNVPLKRAADSLLADKAVLEDADVARLHCRFIAERDAANADRFEADLRRIMDELARQTAITGEKAERYGEALGEHVARAAREVDSPALSSLVRSLIERTVEMKSSVGALQSRLDTSAKEVRDLKDALERAEGEVLTDPLTGARNRRGFERAAREAAAARGENLAGCTLLMADIDHFKRVNDSYGHLFGDQVIRAIAQALRAQVKGRDTVARYGGEEFAALLPDTPVEAARALAERVCAAIRQSRIRRLDTNEYVGGITISIGLAGSREGEPLDRLMLRADEALYASKHAGRDRVTVAAGD
ncbi:MAG: diguanylate cyclase [Burkholderiales bacterium]|nr:diguanylate cyclase [Burkholderiales bacterium]